MCNPLAFGKLYKGVNPGIYSGRESGKRVEMEMREPPKGTGERALLAGLFSGKRATHRVLAQLGILLIVSFLLLNVLGEVPGSSQSVGKMLWFVVGFYTFVRVGELVYKAVRLAFFVP